MSIIFLETPKLAQNDAESDFKMNQHELHSHHKTNIPIFANRALDQRRILGQDHCAPKTGAAAAITTRAEAFEREPEPESKPNLLEEYASRIAIAGVEDAYKSRSKLERRIWLIVLVIALIAMLYVSSAVFNRYSDQKRVYDDQQVVGEIAPFPNVSLCMPVLVNKSIALDILRGWSVPQRIRQRMVRTGVTWDDVINYISGGLAFYSTKSERDTALSVIAMKILDEVQKTFLDQFSQALRPPCAQMITNCRFYGRQFDCCSAAQFLAIDHGLCWQISVRDIPEISSSPYVTGGASADPVRLTDSGLEFDASYDSSIVMFEDDLATEGFIIHIGTMPTPISTPIVIPSRADALITLASPKRVSELSECVSSDHLPQLERFSYYDPYAVHCYGDLLMKSIFFELGCTAPLLSYIPNGSLCDAQRALILMELVRGQLEDLSKETSQKVKGLRDFARSVFYGDVCPPHCTRWSYPVLSASYGYMQYQQETTRIWSMSRLRIFFPASSYHQHTEETVSVAYLIFCDMGGVWGVYLGLSIVSLAQGLAYSAVIVWRKVRENGTRR